MNSSGSRLGRFLFSHGWLAPFAALIAINCYVFSWGIRDSELPESIPKITMLTPIPSKVIKQEFEFSADVEPSETYQTKITIEHWHEGKPVNSSDRIVRVKTISGKIRLKKGINKLVLSARYVDPNTDWASAKVHITETIVHEPDVKVTQIEPVPPPNPPPNPPISEKDPKAQTSPDPEGDLVVLVPNTIALNKHQPQFTKVMNDIFERYKKRLAGAGIYFVHKGKGLTKWNGKGALPFEGNKFDDMEAKDVSSAFTIAQSAVNNLPINKESKVNVVYLWASGPIRPDDLPEIEKYGIPKKPDNHVTSLYWIGAPADNVCHYFKTWLQGTTWNSYTYKPNSLIAISTDMSSNIKSVKSPK